MFSFAVQKDFSFVGKIGQMGRKMKLNHLLIPHARINSKWIKDLNVRPQTIKILRENIDSRTSDIACNNIVSDLSPQAKETKEKVNTWNYSEKLRYS